MAVEEKQLQSEDEDQEINDHLQGNNYDMQVIGRFLSYASRGDRVGLNMMLREKVTSPDVQDYDQRTAMHLAASEGHAPIVELLLFYKANLNLKDRWQRTTVRHDQDTNEVKFDISELDTQQVSTVDQGVLGESIKVKWRGTWVVKTVIKSQIPHPVEINLLSAKDDTLLRELRHPNILQFLGSIVDDQQVILITEHLSKGNLDSILAEKIRLDLPIAIRFALDIARGMNYLHEHKPLPIIHNHLHPRNLLQDGGGHLKIGEYWVQMLYEQGQAPNQSNGYNRSRSTIQDIHTNNDISAFGFIFYQVIACMQMLEGKKQLITEDYELKFALSRCPQRIKQLIERCVSKKGKERPSFAGIIETLEEVLAYVKKAACPVC
ncbi:Integrin-linked protein kinase 1 [Linum perenne]